MASPINFRNLGYWTAIPKRRTSAAVKSAVQLWLNEYLAKNALISSKKAPELYRRCYDVLHRLTDLIGVSRKQTTLHIVDDEDANASICPASGDLFISLSLLDRDGFTQGELAAVFAHELGHYLKHQKLEIPARFKNSLFMGYFAGTLQARQQYGEYEAHELALIIMDAAGYSVDEAAVMLGFLTEEGKAKRQTSAGTKVLKPGSSHPDIANSLDAMTANINNRKFIWRNRGAASKRLFDKEFWARNKICNCGRDLTAFSLRLTFIHGSLLPEKRKRAIVDFNIFDVESIDLLVCENGFSEDMPLRFLFRQLIKLKLPGMDQEGKNRLNNTINCIRKRINDGDPVACRYFQALACALYERDPAGLEQTVENYKITVEEIIQSILDLIKEANSFAIFDYVGKATWQELYMLGSKIVICGSGNDRIIAGTDEGGLTFREVVSPFPPSFLRDRLIAALINIHLLVQDGSDYKETVFAVEKSHPYKLKAESIRLEKAREVLEFIYSATSLDFSAVSLHDLLGSISDREIIFGQEYDVDIMHALSNELIDFVFSVCQGAPYSRKELESLLHDHLDIYSLININDLRENKAITYKNITYKDTYKETYAENLTKHAMVLYKAVLGWAHKNDGHVRERIGRLGRIILSRFMEIIPLGNWDNEVLAEIESMPPSSEKNYLLLMLHQESRRSVKDNELFFEEIPRPDELGGFDGELTLLNSFGFLDSSIYPDGQRVLDRYKGEALPPKGALNEKEIIKLIPRPSPGRDELLTRCQPTTKEKARKLLEAYWSPAAAYAKAHEISAVWMGKSAGNPSILLDILAITREFPSLKRKMTLAWLDLFGIERGDYQKILGGISSADVVDLLKGGMISGLDSNENFTSKLALCLLTFSLSLSRDGFSLLSIKDESVKDSSERENFEKIPELKWEQFNLDKQLATVQKRRLLFRDYMPLMPEHVDKIAELLMGSGHSCLDKVPFIDNTPVPDERFRRKLDSKIISEDIAEAKKWDGLKSFFAFMQAVGLDEAVMFFEKLLSEQEGIGKIPDVFEKLEKIFLDGIYVMLQEKQVPLTRCQTVKEGLQALLSKLPMEVRVKIWARILGGIAQKQDLSQITREAIRPLGVPGGKLMQAIHSLAAGDDPTLEYATRLALDQTNEFSTFDAFQFLAFRKGAEVDPFSAYSRYIRLGSGAQRTAIAGYGDEGNSDTFLEVHSSSPDERIIHAVVDFIHALQRAGKYFPLDGSQFLGLVRQAEKERLIGFENHRKYAELHGHLLGEVKIPRLIADHGDWAQIETVEGKPFSALGEAEAKEVSEKVIQAAFGQFLRTQEDGSFLVNPEFHAGNILVGKDGIFLVDCGLLGSVTRQELLSVLSLAQGFSRFGLHGAVAALLYSDGKRTLEQIDKLRLKNSLAILQKQIDAGLSPELLLPALGKAAEKAGGPEITEGMDTLFRALQHLAPYIKNAGKDMVFGLFPSMFMRNDFEAEQLAKEIKKLVGGEANGQSRERKLPSGLAVGRKLKDGKIQPLGILREEADPEDPKNPYKSAGMLMLKLGDRTQYVRPLELVVQAGQNWVEYAEIAGIYTGLR